MKRIILLSFFLSVGMMLHAQTAEKKWAVGFGGGAYYGNTNEGTGLISEFYLSRYLSSSFDLMLLNNLGLANSEVTNTLDFGTTFLNLRYKLNNGYILKENSSVQPYLYGGPGYIQDNKTEGLNWDAGLGFKFPLSSSVSLFLEGGFIEGLRGEKAVDEGTYTESFWKGVGGIEISFGKSKDTDNDGVPDRKDDCPNTPEGVAVDDFGCPVDSDGDGVPDYKDDCPTEAGDIALNGCPDRDGDGVADKDDECPDTAGLKALKGCPDSDGDGVTDSKDKCPDTPKGYKVDASGCPIDTDGDGLVDEEDECPAQAGSKENNGCPDLTPEFDNIQFDFDNSKINAAAMQELEEVAQTIKDNPEMVVSLYGYADEVGTAAYNMGLSERRAIAVRKFLIAKGIASEQIANVQWFGKAKPIAPNDTEAGRAKNRRVEIKVD
ncbi:OmpA family protein [Sunxiuqinia sp. sy24]|uniref:OmpA family protein n=1 Tax=Sunxiuqinia sp. sy24 TaxID=3461495 RepID=UPI0040463D46